MSAMRGTILFFHGLTAMGLGVAGLLFLRFWRDTGERLFAIFAAAFWALTLNFVVLGLAQPTDETRHFVYLIRLLGFLLIIWGIVDTNRRGDRRGG